MKATEFYQSRISVTAQMDYCARVYEPGRVSIVCLEITDSTACPKATFTLFTWRFSERENESSVGERPQKIPFQLTSTRAAYLRHRTVQYGDHSLSDSCSKQNSCTDLGN